MITGVREVTAWATTMLPKLAKLEEIVHLTMERLEVVTSYSTKEMCRRQSSWSRIRCVHVCVCVCLFIISEISGKGCCNAMLFTPLWRTSMEELQQLLLELI